MLLPHATFQKEILKVGTLFEDACEVTVLEIWPPTDYLIIG